MGAMCGSPFDSYLRINAKMLGFFRPIIEWEVFIKLWVVACKVPAEQCGMCSEYDAELSVSFA